MTAASFDLAASLPPLVRSELGPLCAGLRFGTPVAMPGAIVTGLDGLQDHVPTMFDGVRRLVPGIEPRALMSQWSKFYFRTLGPAALAIAVVHARPLRLDPAACRIVLIDGLPAELWFPADSWIAPAAGDPLPTADWRPDPNARLGSLMHEQLPAAIAAMADAVRVAPRVLWSNAGNLLEYVMERMRHVPGLAQRAAADYAWLFDGAAGYGEDRDNPLHRTVRYVTAPPSPRLPAPMRVRRVCCLRYQLAGKGTRCEDAALCGACPLLLTMTPAQLAKQQAQAPAE